MNRQPAAHARKPRGFKLNIWSVIHILTTGNSMIVSSSEEKETDEDKLFVIKLYYYKNK
jgi:hypothetical protein